MLLDTIRKVAPRALPTYLRAFETAEADLAAFGINTPLRAAHFLAQTLHESGGLTVLRENMRYTHGDRILEIFGVGHSRAAVRSEEVPGLVGSAEALAERVYGLGCPSKAHELGNTEPGDGYRYRGNGLLQTTGREAHRRLGQRIGVDLETNPELATDPRYALRLAAAEWQALHCNEAADADDIGLVTRRVNGGTNGLAERKVWLAKVRPLALVSGPGAANAPASRAIEAITGPFVKKEA